MTVVEYPALKQSDLGGWGADNGKGTFHYEGVFIDIPEYYKDFATQLKVELIGGSDRGAIINIWQKMVRSVFRPKDASYYSDGEFPEWMRFDQINFNHYANAVEEFNVIADFGDILELCRRNS